MPDHTPVHDDCPQCGDDFDEHAMIMTSEQPPGGIMLCPAPGCECFATWGINGIERPSVAISTIVMPSDSEIAAYRAVLQEVAG